MKDYVEFLIEQQISIEIDELFESSNLNEAIFKGAKIKKALKRWGESNIELAKVDYQTKKKMQDPNTDAETDAKIKAAGDKRKEAIKDTIKTAEDEVEILATTDRLKNIAALAKIKYRRVIDKKNKQFAADLEDKAAEDAAEEAAKKHAQKEKELSAKNAEYNKLEKFDEDINAAKIEVEKLEKQLSAEKDDEAKKDIQLQIIDKKIVLKELQAKKMIVNGKDATDIKNEITKLKDEYNRIKEGLNKQENN